MKKELAGRRSVIAVYSVLSLLVLAAMIRSIMLANYGNAFLCLLVLALFMIPQFIRKSLRLQLPDTLEIIILLFIFCAEILGELQCYYLQYAHWDALLHTVWGFLCAAIGFGLIDVLNQSSRIKFQLSPFFVAAVAFCFSMTVGVFWEFFEYGVDYLFHTDMQKDTVVTYFYSTLLDPSKSNTPIAVQEIQQTLVNGELLVDGGYLDIGLLDTMADLLVNFIGALVFSIIGYFYIKSRGKGVIANALIPVMEEENTLAIIENNGEEIPSMRVDKNGRL